MPPPHLHARAHRLPRSPGPQRAPPDLPGTWLPPAALALTWDLGRHGDRRALVRMEAGEAGRGPRGRGSAGPARAPGPSREAEAAARWAEARAAEAGGERRTAPRAGRAGGRSAARGPARAQRPRSGPLLLRAPPPASLPRPAALPRLGRRVQGGADLRTGGRGSASGRGRGGAGAGGRRSGPARPRPMSVSANTMIFMILGASVVMVSGGASRTPPARAARARRPPTPAPCLPARGLHSPCACWRP